MLNFVFGDSHGTGEELERLIEPLAATHNLISVGDLFDRAPHGVKVWELIQKYNIKSTMGNHEAKMLDYLTGKREWLSSNYYSFLNEFSNNYNLQDLVDFLSSLPKIIKINNTCLVTHAAVNLQNPWLEDKSINCFGKYPENPKLNEGRRGWQEKYTKEVLVLYGHVTFPEVNFGYSKSGLINSIGLDTSACHGNKLTGYSVEQNRFYSVKSKEDYFGKVRGLKLEPNTLVKEFVNNNGNKS
jgi:hypothetical protein